jgi:aminopeptidase N
LKKDTERLPSVVAHEIAHQWWGGIVSWETTADNWITEGLATYCSLIYMKDLLGEKEYARIRRRLRLFVKRFAGIATPSAGGKLRLLFKDPAVYQSQVYAKPALMLAELADTLGETELLRRLRSILETRRCRSLNTEEFLNLLCGDDPSLRPRLNEWIHSRDLPKELRSLKRSPCP